jgi:hypothetical protein
MSTPTATRPPGEVIRAQLAQYLGPFTAKNAVNMVAKKELGTDGDHIMLGQVPKVLEALGPTLRTLLGKEGAEKVTGQILKELKIA